MYIPRLITQKWKDIFQWSTALGVLGARQLGNIKKTRLIFNYLIPLLSLTIILFIL